MQLYPWISSPDATVGHKGVLTKALVMPLIFPLFFLSPLFFSPQALQPYTEKAGGAQGAGQRAELPVYSRQNTGGWVNLMCAAGSVAEHWTAECVTACRFSLYFNLSLSLYLTHSLSLSLFLPLSLDLSLLSLPVLCMKLRFAEHNHNIEVEMRHATYPVD